MIKPAAFLLWCSLASWIPCQVDAQPLTQAAADAALAQARQELAPDRRTAVFDVQVTADEGGVTLTGEIHSAELERRLLDHLSAAGATSVQSRLTTLPSAELGEQTFGVVCVSVANLRSKPGHSQELGTQALLGTPLRLLKEQGGWFLVQTPNDYLCWTRDRIQRMTPEGFEAWRNRDKVIVTETYAVARSRPNNRATPVSDLVAGGLLAVEGERDGHYRVGYADGRTGYLQRSAAMPFDDWLATTKDDPERITATARRFFGVPYLWGGTSTKGMDCSGFTSTVYMLNGVILPRDASQQVLSGTAVPFAQSFERVQPGDLLFFGSKATGSRKERVTHVGISLGGARFIHASTDVHENSFDPGDPDHNAYLLRRLLHIRRVTGLGPEHGVQPIRSHPLYVAAKNAR